MPTADPVTAITEDDDAGWGGARTTIPEETSSEPGDEDESNAAPPADDASSTPDSESAPDEEVEGDEPKKPETAEEKAAREKEELVKNRWKLVEKAKKEHLAVAAERKKLQASSSKLEQERAQFRLEQQAAAREVQEARQYAQLVAQVKQNPTLAGLRALGFDYQALTTEMINAGTPEAMAKEARDEARALREQLQRQHAEQNNLQVNRRDANALVAHVEQNEELYPDLATYPPEKIAEDGIALRDMYMQEHRRFPTYQWVVEQLQERASKFEAARKARAAKRAGGATTSEATALTSGNGPRASGPPGKPSIGNAATTTRASAPRQRTEEETDEWALEQLRALRRAR